jgi:hypothetical protein
MSNDADHDDTTALNELQDAVLAAISAARDAISVLFTQHGRPKELIDNTLMRMCSYLSDRSQAVSYLVSAGYVWDGEIVLRSFYEANARIWFICHTEASQRQELVEEFWGDLGDIHNYKRGRRAVAPRELFNRNLQPQDEAVFEFLTRDDFQKFTGATKKNRKAIEQKWSFTEIVQYLKKDGPPDFNWRDIEVLLHTYCIASHLIHADESALDLMLDRQLRAKEEVAVLASAHICRIFSDQVSLWTLSAMTIAHRFGQKPRLPPLVKERWENVSALSEVFLKRFHATQADFYSEWLGPKQPE